MTIAPKINPSILLVDDDRLVLSTLSSGLKTAGYQVHTAENVNEAEEWLDKNERPDLVLLDMSMPGRSGIELTSKLKELNDIPFIMLTAYSEKEIIDQAKKGGAIAYLVKPVGITQVMPAVETAITRSEELQSLRKTRAMLQIALDGDRAVSVAVGIVMDRNHLNHDEAFELIRRKSRSNHLKLIDVARSINSACENLNTFQLDNRRAL